MLNNKIFRSSLMTALLIISSYCIAYAAEPSIGNYDPITKTWKAPTNTNISVPAERSSSAGGLSIGLGYPYLSIKYNFPVLTAEGRFVTDSGIKVYAGRGYWNFYSSNKLRGFTGLEGGYITFNTLDTKGTGYEGALFIGGEYFITKNLSLLLDLAPTFISLKDKDDTSVTVSGVEFVANIGLYFYFGE